MSKHLIFWFLVTRWEVPWYNSMRTQRHLHKNASQHIWCSWGTLRLQRRFWGHLRVSKMSRLRALSPPISPTYWNQKIQTWARMYTNISNTKCVYYYDLVVQNYLSWCFSWKQKQKMYLYNGCSKVFEVLAMLY